MSFFHCVCVADSCLGSTHQQQDDEAERPHRQRKSSGAQQRGIIGEFINIKPHPMMSLLHPPSSLSPSSVYQVALMVQFVSGHWLSSAVWRHFVSMMKECGL